LAVLNIFVVRYFRIGLSNGNIPHGSFLDGSSNSYANIGYDADSCWLSGRLHYFELADGAIKPKWNRRGERNEDVLGCGLLLNSKNKLFIFFTGNGIMMGQSPL
jgi:hypothetical protein